MIVQGNRSFCWISLAVGLVTGAACGGSARNVTSGTGPVAATDGNTIPSGTNSNVGAHGADGNAATTPVASSFVGGPGSQVFANGYSCTTAVKGTGTAADVVIRLALNGNVTNEYVVGAAGSLTAVRAATGDNMLGPPICADVNNDVDRISQWTCWDVQGDANGLFHANCGSGDCRYNVTQAGRGTCENQYTQSVALSSTSCQLDVYSYHPLQWNTANQSYFGGGGITALTQITVPTGDGSIHVRRSLLLPAVTVSGVETEFGQFYMEHWNALPVAHFPYAAYSYDGNSGLPNWYYRAGANMPSYAGQPSNQTYGFVTAFSSPTAGARTLALAFSRENPCVYNGSGSCTDLAGAVTWANLQDQSGSGVVALLPGVHFDHVPVANAIVEQHMDVMAWDAAPTAIHSFLATKAAASPRPRLIPAGVTPADSNREITQLRTYAGQGGAGAVQVGHIGALVQRNN